MIGKIFAFIAILSILAGIVWILYYGSESIKNEDDPL